MYDELDKLPTFFPGIDWPDKQEVLRKGFILNPEDWAYIRSAIELAESGRATGIDYDKDLLKTVHTFRVKYTSSPNVGTAEDKLKTKFDNMQEKTKRRYREMWEIMCAMDEEFKELALDKNTNNPKPKLEDYRDRIIENMGPGGTGVRTISSVRKFGEAGLLN